MYKTRRIGKAHGTTGGTTDPLRYIDSRAVACKTLRINCTARISNRDLGAGVEACYYQTLDANTLMGKTNMLRLSPALCGRASQLLCRGPVATYQTRNENGADGDSEGLDSFPGVFL